MPQGPLQLERNAQTLQQARGGRTPEEMARILGVARDALGDAASNVYDWLMPQDMTDLAAELVPGSKGVGAAIGLIPPKYIQPLVRRLLGMIEQEKGWRPEVQEKVWDSVAKHPRVAAHIDEIRPYRRYQGHGDPEQFDDVPTYVVGDYVGLDKSGRELLMEGGPDLRRQYIEDRLDDGKGFGQGARIRVSPEKAATGGLFEPQSPIIDHELTHAAQDLWNPQAFGSGQRYYTYEYDLNPFEMGANASADPMGGSYLARLERQLNSGGMLEAIGTPERAKAINDMNRTLANQGRRIVLDPKSKMLRIVLNR